MGGAPLPIAKTRIYHIQTINKSYAQSFAPIFKKDTQAASSVNSSAADSARTSRYVRVLAFAHVLPQSLAACAASCCVLHTRTSSASVTGDACMLCVVWLLLCSGRRERLRGSCLHTHTSSASVARDACMNVYVCGCRLCGGFACVSSWRRERAMLLTPLLRSQLQSRRWPAQVKGRHIGQCNLVRRSSLCGCVSEVLRALVKNRGD